MKEQLKALTKETVVYGASTVMGKFLNFLLVPFYVNVLASSAEYGIATSLYTYMSFFNVIYPLGLEAAYFRYASRGEHEEANAEEDRRMFSSPFLVILILGSVISVLLFLLAPSLVYPVFFDSKSDITPMVPMLTEILRYSAAILLLDSLAIIPFAVLRLEHKAKLFASIRFLNIAITLVLNFLFILHFHWGVEGIFRANLVASFAMLLMLGPTIWRRLEFKISKPVLKRLIPFGLTNVPAYLSAMMVQVIDRPIVQAYLGLAMLGVYQANYRMGFIMMVLVSLFEYAWRPFFLRQSKTDDERARILFARIFTYFMLLALMTFLFLSFALPYMVSTKIPFLNRQLLTDRYLSGLDIIPVVLFAYIFQGMYTNFIAGIYIKERNKVLPFITGLGAAVNIATNLLLVPTMGMMGAAIATLLAYASMAAALYWQSQKVYYVPYDWSRVGRVALIVLSAYGIDRLVTLEGFVTSYAGLLGMRTTLFLASLVALWMGNFFSKGERQVLMAMLPFGRTVKSEEKQRPDLSPPEPIQQAEEKKEEGL